MKIIQAIKTLIYLVTKCNIVKTIFVNYKVLPLRIAWKLPIYVYGKVIFKSLSGKVIFSGDIHTGMIKIGKNDFYVKTSIPLTCWTINGTLKFNGPFKFLNGGYMCISKTGNLELGGNGFIGSDYKIMCFDSINIGHHFEATYNVQIYDTSYHYVKQENGRVGKLTLPIVIGNNVWVGNNTIISKGAVIPAFAIIANNSLVNKDFSDIEADGLLLAGTPAAIKKLYCKRIFEIEEEKFWDRTFGYDRTHL